MEKRKIIGYRCLTDWSDQFTKDKLYHLILGKSLTDICAFIDDRGVANGWSNLNYEHFEPVYEELNYELPEKWYIKGCKELSNYFIEKNKIRLIPAYIDCGYYMNNNRIWAYRPISKLTNYTVITLQQYLNSINNKMESKKIYYLKQEVKLNQEIDFNGLKIKVTQDLIDNNPNLFQIEDEVKKEDKQSLVLCINEYHTFKKGETYKSTANINNTVTTFGLCKLTLGKSNSEHHFIPIKKINYYKDSDGFIHKYYNGTDNNIYDTDGNIGFGKCITETTEEEYNKQLEKVEEDKKSNLALCIRDNVIFKRGDVAELAMNSLLLLYFTPIKKINYYKDSDGFIHKFYYTYKGFFNADGNPCDITEYLNNCHAISNEDAYNKQQEIIKNLPEYVKDNRSGMIFKTEYKPNETYSIKYVNPKFKRCINNMNVIIEHYTPSTKEEYDKQEELQQLMDEAQKRYPVGTKLSKDCAVTLHPNNKTYLVYSDGKVSVHIGGIYTVVKQKSSDWYPEYKEPVKDLKFYENKYNSDFYINLYLKHTNLYYQLILQNIADDLNGDWKVDWSVKNSNNKYYIYINHNGSFNIDFHNALNHGEIFFKSEELAKQAINIMGVDKLKIIFNVK